MKIISSSKTEQWSGTNPPSSKWSISNLFSSISFCNENVSNSFRSNYSLQNAISIHPYNTEDLTQRGKPECNLRFFLFLYFFKKRQMTSARWDYSKSKCLTHRWFTTVTNDNTLLGPISTIHLLGLNQPHHIHAFKNLAENDMPLVQPWRLHKNSFCVNTRLQSWFCDDVLHCNGLKRNIWIQLPWQESYLFPTNWSLEWSLNEHNYKSVSVSAPSILKFSWPVVKPIQVSK